MPHIGLDWRSRYKTVTVGWAEEFFKSCSEAVLPHLLEHDRWLEESLRTADKDLVCSGCYVDEDVKA